jgi:hypothetical protein
MHRYDFAWNRRDHIRLSSRSLPRAQSLYFVKDPWSPAPTNLDGKVNYYPAERIAAMRQLIAGLDRKAYFQNILDTILPDAGTDKEQVSRICGFVGDSLYYNPIQQPEDVGSDESTSYADHSTVGIYDAVELLELHDGRCGQGVMVTLALLDAAGIEARKVLLDHHVSCEAFYDGDWHLADALMFGASQPHRDGNVLSGEEIRRDPYFTDAFPMPYLYGTLEEYFTADGFRCLGYAFGEWGSSLMPYHSWYWGAPLDNPPTLPYPLVTQRLDGQRVRLNWSPSFKVGGGNVEYRVEIFTDRDCTNCIHKDVTRTNALEWEVPQANTLTYFEVRAMDDHRRFNPDTWYMATRNNFMLVSKEQYGWYGVV